MKQQNKTVSKLMISILGVDSLLAALRRIFKQDEPIDQSRAADAPISGNFNRPGQMAGPVAVSDITRHHVT